MAISTKPPKGGIVAELGGKDRPLILRNEEVERFEDHHGLGIFAMVDQLLGRAGSPQARHVRDLVALGLSGGGMPDKAADDIVAALGPAENFRLRQIALDLVLVAFTPEKPEKKSEEDGSAETKTGTATSGTSGSGSKTSSRRASSRKKSGA